MKKPFCAYLKNQIRVEYTSYSPCCWITKKHNLATGTEEEFDAYKQWLNQIDDWVPECNYCQDKENHNHQSPRQRAEVLPSILGINDPTEVDKVTSLEFQIDSNCNAACLMCSSNNSTTWEKYEIGNMKNKKQSSKKIDLIATEQTEVRYNNARDIVPLDNINLVTFLGGEPLLVDFHKKLLNDIKQHRPLNKLTVKYITNGSQLPDAETVDLWRQLKELRILFSIDGTEEHFNYLRWPLQWSQVESNIKYFINLNLPSVRFMISSAISPFNIFYYDRYIAWEKEIFKTIPTLEPRFSRAFSSNGPINTYSIPEKLQEVIKEKYADQPWLVNQMRMFDQEQFTKFMEYVEYHDSKRNLNWQEVFPEVAEYFIK